MRSDRTITLLPGGVPLAAVCLLLACASSPAQRWQQVRARDSLEAYSLFLALHANEPKYASYVPLALRRIGALHSLTAERLGTITAYAAALDSIDRYLPRWTANRLCVLGLVNTRADREFAKNCALNPIADSLRERMHSLAWQEADIDGSIDAYIRFLTGYPGARQAAQAEVRLKELRASAAYEAARADHSISAYTRFVGAFPSAQQTQTAKEALMQLHYEHARREGTLEAYREAEQAMAAHLPSFIRADSIRMGVARLLAEEENRKARFLRGARRVRVTLSNTMYLGESPGGPSNAELSRMSIAIRSALEEAAASVLAARGLSVVLSGEELTWLLAPLVRVNVGPFIRVGAPAVTVVATLKSSQYGDIAQHEIVVPVSMTLYRNGTLDIEKAMAELAKLMSEAFPRLR